MDDIQDAVQRHDLEHRDAGVRHAQGVANRSGGQRGGPASSQRQGHLGSWVLSVRDVDLRARPRVEANELEGRLDVADHAHHPQPRTRLVAREAELAAHCAVVWPELRGQARADQDDPPTLEGLLFGEPAPLPNGDLQAPEIAVRDGVVAGEKLLASVHDLALGLDARRRVAVPARGEVVGGPDGLGLGEIGGASQGFLEKRDPLLGITVGLARQRQAHGQDPIGLVADVDRLEMEEALGHQQGAHQQHQRHGEL